MGVAGGQPPPLLAPVPPGIPGAVRLSRSPRKVVNALPEVRQLILPGTAPQAASEHELSLARSRQHLNALIFPARHPSLLFRFSLRKSPRRRFEPNGVKNPRPANRASAGAAA